MAERHVRRLEAMRRVAGSVSREADGSWTIAPDHIARAEAYERMLARQAPVVTETLSAQPIEQLPTHDGATWLDRGLVSGQAQPPDRGFGTEVRQARALRQQWLVEQGLAETDGESITYRLGMLATLQQRELRRVAGQLSKELGLTFTEAQPYEHIEGKVTRNVQLGDKKFALVDLRHSYAVTTLLRWYRAGEDVERLLPILSTYLGHSHTRDTYWYLSACPELMEHAARRLEAHWEGVS